MKLATVKVLFLNTERGWRGGERQTFLAMRGLRSLGVTVELVARPGSTLAETARNDGFVVHTRVGFFSILRWLLSNETDYDAFHAHTASTASVLAVFRLYKRKPVLFTRRTDFFRPNRTWLRKLKWRQFDQIIAVSHSAAQEPVRLGFHPIVVRSSVPLVAPNQVRVQTFLEQHELLGKTLIGTAGVFIEDKDPLTSIQVAAEICAGDANVVFLHWGSGGDLESLCKQQVKELNLEAQYVFLGFMASPEELYPCLSAYVSTSRTEALGTSILDAMVQCVPVVATNVGGLRETLDGGRGYLTPVENPIAIAETLSSVLRNTSEATQRTKLAYAYVCEKHNVIDMARRYVEVYAKLVNQTTVKCLLST